MPINAVDHDVFSKAFILVRVQSLSQEHRGAHASPLLTHGFSHPWGLFTIASLPKRVENPGETYMEKASTITNRVLLRMPGFVFLWVFFVTLGVMKCTASFYTKYCCKCPQKDEGEKNGLGQLPLHSSIKVDPERAFTNLPQLFLLMWLASAPKNSHMWHVPRTWMPSYRTQGTMG